MPCVQLSLDKEKTQILNLYGNKISDFSNVLVRTVAIRLLTFGDLSAQLEEIMHAYG